MDLAIDVAPPLRALITLWSIAVGLPLLTLLGVSIWKHVNVLQQPAAWVALGVCALTAFGVTHFAKSSIRVERGAVVLSGLFVNQRYERGDLQIDHAVAFDLGDRNGAYGLSLRTMGTSLPGFNSGRFRLRNGIPALVLLTSDAAVYIPGKPQPLVVDHSAFVKIMAALSGPR